MPHILRVKDIAFQTGVDQRTVRRWLEAGQGPHFFRTPGGQYRVERQEFETWYARLSEADGMQIAPAVCQ